MQCLRRHFLNNAPIDELQYPFYCVTCKVPLSTFYNVGFYYVACKCLYARSIAALYFVSLTRAPVDVSRASLFLSLLGCYYRLFYCITFLCRFLRTPVDFFYSVTFISSLKTLYNVAFWCCILSTPVDFSIASFFLCRYFIAHVYSLQCQFFVVTFFERHCKHYIASLSYVAY